MRDVEDEEDDPVTWLDRRDFGKILVAGVGGLSLAATVGAQESKPPAAMPVGEFDVIIIGAGLSGLIAARELQRSRHFEKILIMEANDRIGGRMDGREVTITTGEGEKTGYIDWGGQWVGPTQDAMLALLDQLHIEKFISYEQGQSLQSWDPTRDPTGKDIQKTVWNGDVSDLYMGECKAPDHFPDDPAARAKCDPLRFPACSGNDKERKIWLQELLEKISVKVPCDQPWGTGEIAGYGNASKLDRKTFQEFLDDNAAEGYTQWLPTVAAHIGGSGGFEPDQVSLLHMAWTQHVGPQSETPELWLLKGGAGQIPKRLETELKDPKNGAAVSLFTSMPTDFIQSVGDQVAVGVKGRTGGAYYAKAVIVAIPPPMRQNIDFSPPLSANYVGYMYGAPMGSMSKVHAVYDSAFWRKECLSGSAAGNLETCEFIADSSSTEGVPGILTSFIAADRNVGLRHATYDQIKELVLRDYSHFFGERALKPKEFFYRNWNNQTWTGGAFTNHPSPGVWTRYGKEGWRKPAGRIFWAGTETAERWPGYFDGAIRAGVRAANEVLQLLHLSAPPPLDPPWPQSMCPTEVRRIKDEIKVK